jgi:transposase-like protein
LAYRQVHAIGHGRATGTGNRTTQHDVVRKHWSFWRRARGWLKDFLVEEPLMATTTVEISQPQGLRTKFEVELPAELAASLQEWFERSVWGEGEIRDINDFASQVMELPLADYRFDHLPPGETDSQTFKRNVLSPSQKQEIFELLDDGECGVTECALRFGVGRSTIRRVLAERAAETGIAMKKKSRLSQAQIEEILRLRQEGVSAVDIGKRFDRCEAAIFIILRANRK